MPGSAQAGKAQIIAWVNKNITCPGPLLDIGPGVGTYHKLFGDRYIMDAVEVWGPYIQKYNLRHKYRLVWEQDIREWKEPGTWELGILGDILEHLSVEDSLLVLANLLGKCRHLIISVPWRFKQGAIHGNPHEIHKQDDLTPDVMQDRYPNASLLHRGAVIGVYTMQGRC